MYCIIASWNGDRVTRYNCVDTELEAQCIVRRKTGAELTDAERTDLEGRLTNPALVEDAVTNKDPETMEKARASNAHLTNGEYLHISNRLYLPLAAEKQDAGCYYAQLPAATPGYERFQNNEKFWSCDPANQAVTFDDAACHAWHLAQKAEAVGREADRRVLAVADERTRERLQARGLQLQDKGRPNWTQAEKDEWDAGMAKLAEVDGVRNRAEQIKTDLAAKTPAEIDAYDLADDGNWSAA